MDEKTKKIRDLNTKFWRDPARNGRIVCTAAVAALGPGFLVRCLLTLQAYNGWNGDHDPFGERDMCVFELDGYRVWAKLAYYDKDMVYGSPDPSDPEQTTRVATIMFPEDY